VEQQTNNEVLRQVTIRNRQGLHARPVMQFVDLANRFPCEIHVRKGSLQVDGKSPMEMMLLEATQGTTLSLVAVGPQADHALGALAKLVESGFGEDT
jgi:phosphotransferase system HPr (HPr) family protein